MKRVGFGLNIAPKVLRCVLSAILPKDSFPMLETYIDDNFLPVTVIDPVRDQLLEHGFETKQPEPLDEARVLGLQNHKDGTWTRKSDSPTLVTLTKRGVHSWTGKLISHFPICKWLRPACSAIKRICSPTPEHWDDSLDANMLKSCASLQKLVDQQGDPCSGKWFYDPKLPWTLYTDASDTAYGAVLQIGDTYVEDIRQLRKRNDTRHINVAETNAVFKGLDLLREYRNALELRDEQIVTLKCDNKSVCT